MDGHQRFETLAVGHVLGGLDGADAAAFRDHLQRCEGCRRRVAELRSIADDLAAAERDERAQAQARDQAQTGDASEPDVPAPAPLTRGQLGATIVVVAVVVALLGFWNLHLRTQVELAVDAATRAEETLEVLAVGRAVAVEVAETVRGQVVADDATVALALAGLPPLEPDERVVVWLLGTDDGDVPALLGRDDEGRLTATLELDGADGVLVTVEQLSGAGVPEEPGSRELLRGELAPSG